MKQFFIMMFLTISMITQAHEFSSLEQMMGRSCEDLVTYVRNVKKQSSQEFHAALDDVIEALEFMVQIKHNNAPITKEEWTKIVHLYEQALSTVSNIPGLDTQFLSCIHAFQQLLILIQAPGELDIKYAEAAMGNLFINCVPLYTT